MKARNLFNTIAKKAAAAKSTGKASKSTSKKKDA